MCGIFITYFPLFSMHVSTLEVHWFMSNSFGNWIINLYTSSPTCLIPLITTIIFMRVCIQGTWTIFACATESKFVRLKMQTKLIKYLLKSLVPVKSLHIQEWLRQPLRFRRSPHRATKEWCHQHITTYTNRG